HEAGGAVAALRAVVVDHGGLHGVELAVIAGEALDRHDLAAREHWKQRDAAVDSAVGGGSRRVPLDDRDRAGSAVALGASLLAAGQAARPEEIEKGRRRGFLSDLDPSAVDREIKAHR